MDNEIWVFLSHSNKDYEKVCKVRNMLEQQGYRPLVFFLNCLNDDDEIDLLIKREIDSRQKFILCNSVNARNSKWVQKEVDYIKRKNRLWEKVDIDASIEYIERSLVRFQSRNTVYINGVSGDNEIIESIARYFMDKDYIVVNIDNCDNEDYIKCGYFVNLYSENVLLKWNTPRFVMNYNKILKYDYITEETAIINVFIDPRDELLRKYYMDPGVDKYEGLPESDNKIIDVDYSDKKMDDIPFLIYDILLKLDSNINDIFNFSESCKKTPCEIETLKKCMELNYTNLELGELIQYGFLFENYHEYLQHDVLSIIRSTAMFELACNYIVGGAIKKSFKEAIKLFYTASILGMKNAQKILYKLGPTVLSVQLVKELEKNAFKSADGFLEYLLAKCVEYKKSFLVDKDAILHLYEYSAMKGCVFASEELRCIHANIQNICNEKHEISNNININDLCIYTCKVNWSELLKRI